MTKELDSVGEKPRIYLEGWGKSKKPLEFQPLFRDMNLELPYKNKVFTLSKAMFDDFIHIQAEHLCSQHKYYFIIWSSLPYLKITKI